MRSFAAVSASATCSGRSADHHHRPVRRPRADHRNMAGRRARVPSTGPVAVRGRQRVGTWPRDRQRYGILLPGRGDRRGCYAELALRDRATNRGPDRRGFPRPIGRQRLLDRRRARDSSYGDHAFGSARDGRCRLRGLQDEIEVSLAAALVAVVAGQCARTAELTWLLAAWRATSARMMRSRQCRQAPPRINGRLRSRPPRPAP